MNTFIKEIATIQTGIFAKPLASGELVYLQAKHFDATGKLLSDLHADLPSDQISQKHLLRQGDILFSAKGSKNFAAVYEEHNLPAVASTSFFILRTTTDKILPNYLAWYLNTPTTMILLKSQAKGSSIASISKQVLESLEISIPAIAVQEKIVQIHELRQKEKTLKEQLEILHDKKLQHLLFNTINK